MGTIVVGIDGSPGSDAALRWAMDEARLRGSKLRVVNAYDLPQVLISEGGVGAAGIAVPAAMTQDDAERLRSSAEEQARGVVESAVQRVGGAVADRPEIESAVVPGPATQALIAAGESAELLVLGSRGRGGFLGLLLGSVSHQIAHHPPCPVVILPLPGEKEPS